MPLCNTHGQTEGLLIVANRAPLDTLNTRDYQSAKKLFDYQVFNQTENCHKVFSLVWQQCTKLMHAKMKSHHDYYQAIKRTLNGIDLLRVMKLICFNIEAESIRPTKGP